MEADVYFVDCEGRGVGNALFVEIMADDRGFAMREYPSADLVELVKTYFSEEDRELVVDESLLPTRLACGVDQRQPPSLDVESALVGILQDERQSIGARSLKRYVGESAHAWEELVDEVRFSAIDASWALTRQRPVEDGIAMLAFNWIFVIQEVFTRVSRTTTRAGFWSWFIHPPSVQVPVTVPRVKERVTPGGQRGTPVPVAPHAGGDDVDLVAVAAGGISAMDVADTVDTLLGMFQRPDRCSPLNDPLPRGGSAQEEGLQLLVRWGVKPVATLGEHIVLPFARGSGTSTAIRSLGKAPFSWKFVAEHMSVGIFHVDAVGYTNYQVSFVKRLVGPTQGVDPITLLKAAAVNLDFQYGLLLTELAIERSQQLMGIRMQPRIINVAPSPIKSLVSPAPVQLVGRKHGRAALDVMDDGEDEEDRRFHQVRMTDSAGLSFVVSKNTSHLVGANQSIFMRTLIPKEERQRMFRMAFAHGVNSETVALYLEPSTILDAAADRLQRTHRRIGGHSVIRSKTVCFWGTIVDERFLCRLVLWVVNEFNSAEERRLCLEHFSSQHPPSTIKTCGELTDCIRNMLSTYDELWALGWKRSLEPLMVEYFENFEAFTNRSLDWGFASRMVMQYFYLLQCAAQNPDEGIRFNGRSVELVPSTRLKTPGDWLDFIVESFVPFCEASFSQDEMYNWNQRKLIQPAIVIYGAGQARHPPKGKGKAGGVGNGAPDTTKAGTEHKEKPGKETITSTVKFCVGDVFKHLGISSSMDATAKGACRGPKCTYTHTSACAARTYGHAAVFNGISAAIKHHSDSAKEAWAKAMQGRGRDLFQKPFGGEQG